MTATNLREVIELLYHIKLLSARWIGMNLTPSEAEIQYLNDSLALCINVLRRIEDG